MHFLQGEHNKVYISMNDMWTTSSALPGKPDDKDEFLRKLAEQHRPQPLAVNSIIKEDVADRKRPHEAPDSSLKRPGTKPRIQPQINFYTKRSIQSKIEECVSPDLSVLKKQASLPESPAGSRAGRVPTCSLHRHNHYPMTRNRSRC